jgi:hypothetical protein
MSEIAFEQNGIQVEGVLVDLCQLNQQRNAILAELTAEQTGTKA